MRTSGIEYQESLLPMRKSAAAAISDAPPMQKPSIATATGRSQFLIASHTSPRRLIVSYARSALVCANCAVSIPPRIRAHRQR